MVFPSPEVLKNILGRYNMITEYNIIVKVICLTLEQKEPGNLLDCLSALYCFYDFYCSHQCVFFFSKLELYKAFAKKHKTHDYQVICLVIKLQNVTF